MGNSLPLVRSHDVYSSYLSMAGSVPGIGRILDHPFLNLFISRSPDGGVVILLRSSLNIPPVKSAKKITVDQRSPADGENWLQITCRDSTQTENFSAIVSYLMEASAVATEEAESLDLFLTKFDQIRELFGNLSTALSTDSLRGLFAELWFLTRRLSTVTSAFTALQSWKGPLGSPHDFVFADGSAVEVKSTQLPPTRVMISSESQLEVLGPQLHLYVLPIEIGTAGDYGSISLRTLITELRLVCRDSREALVAMEECFLSLGTTQSNPQFDQFNALVGDELIFEVHGEFPRIMRSELRPGISHVTYEIDLRTLAAYRTSIARLLEPQDRTK